MKVLILGGFLGSGKTSLLLQLAYYIAGHASGDKKYQVVILENEVGEEGIDDKLLRGNGYQVENLFSGCACCTLSGELLSTVSSIEKQMDPDWLILEATGLAYPYLIQKNLTDSMCLSSRICIVADASRWERLFTPLHELITGQLTNADTVLINKMDLVTQETLKKIELQIQTICEVPRIFKTSANQPVSHCIWDFILGGILMNEISHEHTHAHDHHGHSHQHHEHTSRSLHKNNTLITLNAYTQDDASVISLEWSSCEDVKQTELLLKQLFKNIARSITDENGIIGHIKASMERTEVIMISLTDTEALKKEALSPTIQIHAAVIALCIDKNTLVQIVESALDRSPLFSI